VPRWWWWVVLVIIAVVARKAIGGGRQPASAREPPVYVGRGSSGRIDCPYIANPPETVIVWQKDGLVVYSDSRIRVNKAGSLMIRAARVDDEGQYACSVYSPSGSTDNSPSIQLLVRGKLYTD